MSNSNIKKLKKERSLLLEELKTLSQMLHGSWVERYSVCSIKNCKCHKGERHGPRHYLVINENGRQRQKYIPNSQVESGRHGVMEYRKAIDIIDRITSINLKLIKERKYGRDE
jgi:hypothetical protein